MAKRRIVSIAGLLTIFACWSCGAVAQSAVPPVQSLTVPNVVFVAEKTGPFESDVKNALIATLRELGAVKDAYLVQVKYGVSEESVALCLFAPGAEPGPIVAPIKKTFQRLASSGVYLDLMFLSSAQQLEVARVAHPFYSAH